jgi:hypothetical protein
MNNISIISLTKDCLNEWVISGNKKVFMVKKLTNLKHT